MTISVKPFKTYLEDPATGGGHETHVYADNDISYYMGPRDRRIEVNSRFGDDGRYCLTISQGERKFSMTLDVIVKEKTDFPDWGAMIKLNREQIKLFVSQD